MSLVSRMREKPRFLLRNYFDFFEGTEYLVPKAELLGKIIHGAPVV
jgi:hypothetical protein